MTSSNGRGLDLSVPLGLGVRASILARLTVRSERAASGCLVWTGYRGNQFGHGAMSVKNRLTYVHQLSYAVHVGPIPPGYDVCHTCDNPPCIDGCHLFLGTRSDNLADMRNKGRGSKPPAHRGESHPQATLTDGQVADIRALWASRGFGQRAIAQQFGVSQSTVWRLIHGVTRDES